MKAIQISKPGGQFELMKREMPEPVVSEINETLHITKGLGIAYSFGLSYAATAFKYLKVRRDVEDFTQVYRCTKKK